MTVVLKQYGLSQHKWVLIEIS